MNGKDRAVRPGERARWLLGVGMVAGLSLAFSTVFAMGDRAQAHGTMEAPASRIFQCRFVENPEQPTSAACRAAIALSGVAAVYDWNEVNLPDVGGRHRERIPDGRLCSAGRDKYRGLDLARADWPATRLTSGGLHDFRFRTSAPHKGFISLFMTRDSYNPENPLRWADLESEPFTVTSRADSGGTYAATARVPVGKHSRHMIYSIWERTDSPEGFYSCSDVVFGNDGDSGVPSMPDPSVPTPLPEPASPYLLEPTSAVAAMPSRPASPLPEVSLGHSGHEQSRTSEPPIPPTQVSSVADWQPGVSYEAGARVTHRGRTYWCVQAHTSQADWEPGATPALWLVVSGVALGRLAVWEPWVSYAVDTKVVHGGTTHLPPGARGPPGMGTRRGTGTVAG